MSLNLYSYCTNDPVNLSDPTGYIAGVDDAVILVVVGIVFAVSAVAAIVAANDTDMSGFDLNLFKPFEDLKNNIVLIAATVSTVFTPSATASTGTASSSYSQSKSSSKSSSKTATIDIAISKAKPRSEERNYWEANFNKKKGISIGNCLTLEEAICRVKWGGNVMCNSHMSAFNLLIAAGYESTMVFHEKHRLTAGHYNHYHPFLGSDVHVWFVN